MRSPSPPSQTELIRPAPPAHQDVLATVPLEAGEHRFRLVAVIGGKGLAPFPGELSVSMARPGEIDRVIGGSDAPLLTDTDWSEFATASRFRHHRDDIERRRQSDESVEAKWEERHRQVREWTLSQPGPEIPRVEDSEWIQNDVDRFVYEGLAEASLVPNALVGDLEFLRRLALDTTGLVPSATMVRSFLAQPAETRRTLAIEQFLESPGLGRFLGSLLAGCPGRESGHPQAGPEQYRAVPLVHPPGIRGRIRIRPPGCGTHRDGREPVPGSPGGLWHGQPE